MNVWEYPLKEKVTRGVFLNFTENSMKERTLIFHRLHSSGRPLITKDGKRIIDHVKTFRAAQAKNIGRMKNVYSEEIEEEAIESIRKYLAIYKDHLRERLKIPNHVPVD